MRKIILLIFVAAVLANCKKDNNQNNNNNNNNNNNSNGIIIKGKISGSKTDKNTKSLADAKKVIIFSKYYYGITDIVNDTFSITGQINMSIALIFIDVNNHYIGNLSAHGLNMLPLGNLINGENTQIDLTTLTLVGNSVIPSHDPFGNEIIMSETEINSLKIIDGYYESIAKNIDADNDSIPDVLSNKQLVVSSIFARYSGHWGFNDSPPVPTDSALSYINYSVEIQGGSGLTFSNGNIILSGPTIDPYTDISTWGYMINPGDNLGFLSSFNRQTNAPIGAPWGTTFLPFKKGTYTLTLDGTQSFTLDYANIDAQYFLVIATPTLHTNNDGNLTSITLEYKLPDGTIINPTSMLTNVMIQFCDNQYNQFYNSPWLTASTGFSIINFDTPLDISSLYQIDIGYNDLLGNSYGIIWH